MSEEELRQVRDTLIEALRRSDKLTIEGRALFRRYAAMSEAEAGTTEVPGPVRAGQLPAQPAVPAVPAVPAAPAARARPVDDDEEFGGSFMVRNDTSPTTPGYRETPAQQTPPVDLPRSMRDRRR